MSTVRLIKKLGITENDLEEFMRLVQKLETCAHKVKTLKEKHAELPFVRDAVLEYRATKETLETLQASLPANDELEKLANLVRETEKVKFQLLTLRINNASQDKVDQAEKKLEDAQAKLAKKMPLPICQLGSPLPMSVVETIEKARQHAILLEETAEKARQLVRKLKAEQAPEEKVRAAVQAFIAAQQAEALKQSEEVVSDQQSVRRLGRI